MINYAQLKPGLGIPSFDHKKTIEWIEKPMIEFPTLVKTDTQKNTICSLYNKSMFPT